MSTAALRPTTRQRARLHPLSLRIMHWINAAAIFIMIGSGWRIYNDDVLFGWLHFPDFLVIGKWAQYGLQWHFFGMWIFVLNGVAYLTYGIFTGRFRQKLFPISLREGLVTIGDALRLRLSHEDLTIYNAVQKILYLGVILVGMFIVITGLCLWKPVQFSEVADLFGSFQTIRLIHFLCMSAVVFGALARLRQPPDPALQPEATRSRGDPMSIRIRMPSLIRLRKSVDRT